MKAQRRNRISAHFLIGILFLVLSVPCSYSQAVPEKITNYKVFYGTAEYSHESILVIREYEQYKQTFYVGVEPDNLKTLIVPAVKAFVKPCSWQEILNNYKSTSYIKALKASQKHSYTLQDAGIVHGFPKEHGITLTIDLCPSHKPLDRVIFTSLITEFKKTERPVPLALSITGRFMNSHADDIRWIKSLVDSGEIVVTWINHTYDHHYNPRLPLRNNFLLEQGTDINFEILQTEIDMLQKGLMFSVFFRFPGLVSDHQVVDSINHYGLIPIGSDAWLAKGQPAFGGSIVLIHGNGNEPLGIKDFISLLQQEKPSVKKKQWLLYDLRETVEDEFQQ
jgi:hypothetical protein